MFLRWQYGLCQTKWCMPDCETSSSFSLSRNCLLMRFRMFKSDVVGARMFLWKPRALSQSWSGSLHASFCWSKVFTSISEKFGWYKMPLSLSISSWVTYCLCSLQPFCCGVVCFWLFWISVWDWLGSALRRLRVLLWLSLPTTENLKFLKRFSQHICEPTFYLILFWHIQREKKLIY